MNNLEKFVEQFSMDLENSSRISSGTNASCSYHFSGSYEPGKKQSEYSNDMNNDKKKKGIRDIFSINQLKLLENVFEQTHYPDSAMREHLSVKLNTNINRIQVWFQNRRAKFRKFDQKNRRPTKPTEKPKKQSSLQTADNTERFTSNSSNSGSLSGLIQPRISAIQAMSQIGASSESLSGLIQPGISAIPAIPQIDTFSYMNSGMINQMNPFAMGYSIPLDKFDTANYESAYPQIYNQAGYQYFNYNQN